MLRTTIRLIATVVILAIPLACPAATSLWTRELAEGVTLTQMLETGSGTDPGCKPQFINALTIDPKAPGVSVRTILAQDKVMNDDPIKGRETVSSMVKRTGAVAGVNGDYHNWEGDPTGLFILNGELVSEPYRIRPEFGILPDGAFLFDKLVLNASATAADGESCAITGVNRQPDGDEMILFTPRYFSRTMTRENRTEVVVDVESGLPLRVGVPITGKVRGLRPGNWRIDPGTVILSGIAKSATFANEHLKPGSKVSIEAELDPRETSGWEKAIYAVGSCPWIVRNGKFYMDVDEERIKPGFYDVPNPRTAVGRRADGKLVIVTVDGRQAMSTGMKLSELASLMISLGCTDAVNLDGGGSTEMALAYGVLNSPSDGSERATATCLAVYGRPARVPTPDFAIAPEPGRVPAGAELKLGLVNTATGLPLDPALASRAVWTTSGNIGAVDLSGCFHALKSHSGQITARVGSRTSSTPVTVTSGSLSRIVANLEKGKEPNTSTLYVLLKDANFNPVKFGKVSIKVTGGMADRTEVTLNDDAFASVAITWDSAATGGQQVEVRSGEFGIVVKR